MPMVRATFGESRAGRGCLHIPRTSRAVFPERPVREDDRGMTTLGERWVTAIAVRDSAGLVALLTDDIDFRGLTPRKAWEATTPAAVADVVLGTWFDDGVT